MTYGHRSITILLLHHELGHRFTHDVRTSEDDTLLTAGLDIVALQQGDDAEGRSRDEARQTDGHASHVDGMETIHILTIVDSLNNLLLVDVLGQGQLNDETIHILVLIELINTSQQLGLRDIILETDKCALKATSLAGQHLVFYVSF